MPALDQILAVNITQATPAPNTTSFGTVLILGSTSPGWSASDYVHTYSSASAMLTDGFTTSSPEYLAALAMYSQATPPSNIKVGKRSAAVAQVDKFNVTTLTTGRTYSITVNGTAYSYTAAGGDTQVQVLNGLLTAIAAAQPVTGSVNGSGAGAQLTVTASTAGQVISYTAIDTQLGRIAQTAASGIATDLANVSAQDNGWYGLATPGQSDAEILQAAPWVEANLKLYVPVTSTAAAATAVTTDVLSSLKAAGYMRTGAVFSPTAGNAYLGAAWLASQLTQTPGSATWAFKSLPGMVADTLSATQQSILIGTPLTGVAGKNANIYQSVGGVPITEMGTAAAGTFFDVMVGLDWLKATIQTNVYSALTSAAKVPMTDRGTTLLLAGVRAALDQGVVNGLIDDNDPTNPIVVTAPLVSSLTKTQRSSRIGPPITFSCRLQGAQHAVTVNGVVSF